MEYNKIKKTDTMEVVNAKLKTSEYKDMDNVAIAHMLVDMNYPLDFNVFEIRGQQIERKIVSD